MSGAALSRLSVVRKLPDVCLVIYSRPPRGNSFKEPARIEAIRSPVAQSVNNQKRASSRRSSAPR
jgi:hypothetical protein